MKLRIVCLMIFSLLLGGVAMAAETTRNGVTVFDPWARATPRGTRVASVYLVARTAPGVADRLVSAYGDIARTAMLQSYVREGGVMRAVRVDAIGIEPGGTTPLVPGGFHILLQDLNQSLAEGQRFRLTLVFERAGEMPVDVEVASMTATEPRGGYSAPGLIGAPGFAPGFVPKGSY